ncbi:MAG: hypothetical protein Fur0040_09960 [Sideroxydans sp.]
MTKAKIERQALSLALLPVLLFALILESYFLFMRMTEMEQALHEQAKLVLRQLASSSEYALYSGNTGALRQQLDVALSHSDVGAAVVQDESGHVLSGGGRITDYARLLQRLNQAGSDAVDEQDQLILRQAIVATPVPLDDIAGVADAGRPLGTVIVVMDKSRLKAAQRQIILVSGLLTLLVLGGSVWIALHRSRRITWPILAMRAAVKKIGEGRLETRIAATHVQELDELGHGINEMAAQLQQQRATLEQRIAEATREMRVQKEQAEQANQDKTRFLAAASHDLRQPMHAMGLFIGELHNRVSTPAQRQIVEKIEESVEAMSGLLDSLLDISKLDAGVVVAQEQVVALAPLLYRLQEDFSIQAMKRGITLHVRECTDSVMSDPLLLHRILMNLVSNALRYTAEHGSVLVACRRRGTQIHIEVRDNGPGIPAEQQQAIFKEFVQLANAARDRSKGLGLGLAIVDRLCRLLGHRIAVRSAPGRGTTFVLELPRVPDVQELLQDPPTIPPVAHKQVRELEGLRVLVVDDDELVRRGTADLLAAWGCAVTEAGSLAQVRANCAQQEFDLVVCDYRLPDGTGLQLADCLVEHHRDQTAFVLVSGDTSPEVLRQVAAHRLHLLHKPVRPAKLRSMIALAIKTRPGAAIPRG